MAEDRVDKAWQAKGLGAYSTAAILGTLRHYGIALDEGGFRALAKDQYPGAIAAGWHETWKGTGQFARFPGSAANELWKRLESDRLAPIVVAEAVGDLMSALAALIAEAPDAPVGDRLAKVQALMAQATEAGCAAQGSVFLEETVFLLGDEGIEALNHLAEELAKQGHVDDALAFAKVEEFLFPVRRGTATALVRALSGTRKEAVDELVLLAGSAADAKETRLCAVDVLIHLEELEAAKKPAAVLLDAADKSNDFHFAFDVAERQRYVLQKAGTVEERALFAAQVLRLQEAHHQAHPDHHH